MSKFEALKLAQKEGVDLVLVGPNAEPPVAKIINFANFKYQQKKKEKSGKKASSLEIKELRLTPFIAENDLGTRLTRAKEFFSEGNRVKIVVKFTGRQITHQEFGRQVLDRVINALDDFAVTDQEPKFQGKTLYMVLKPRSKARKKEE